MAKRLDTMSRRLRNLIVEGQKALAAGRGSSDGWTDASPGLQLDGPDYWAVRVDGGDVERTFTR